MVRPAGNENLNHIERLAAEGNPLKALDHPAFAALLQAGRHIEDREAIVARRREIAHRLGSGAMHLVTIEHITLEGGRMLNENQTNPILGSVTNRVVADRPFELPGRRVERQWTELGIAVKQQGDISIAVDGSVPFDDVMEQDTREVWQQWGFNLIYHVNDEGGVFALQPQPGYGTVITARLASME